MINEQREVGCVVMIVGIQCGDSGRYLKKLRVLPGMGESRRHRTHLVALATATNDAFANLVLPGRHRLLQSGDLSKGFCVASNPGRIAGHFAQKPPLGHRDVVGG